MSISMKPMYDTKKFTEIYDNVDKFISDYFTINLGGLTTNQPQEEYGLLPKLYYLLYAKYGNTPIANFDENQFKYKLFSIVFMYAPTWEKRLEIQSKLRNISENDLLVGSKAIYNQALNPETTPKTSDLDELDYINQQNTTNYKKSKMDAYAQL